MPQQVINPQTEEVLLDLDEIVTLPKYIKYKGEKHLIHEPSVDGYLKVLLVRRTHLRGNGGTEDEYVQIQQAAELVINSIPTIPRADLLEMGMAKLMKITQAIEEASTPLEKAVEDTSPNETVSESVSP